VRRRAQIRRARDAHSRAADHDKVSHLRWQIGGGQACDHRPVAVADHRDPSVRAHGGQIPGESVQGDGAGSCQLLTRRRAPDALRRVVSEPGDHGYVPVRRRRARGVIQGPSLHRRGTVANVTEASVEVVRAVGDPGHQHGNPLGCPQITEHLDDPSVAARVERQELTALSGPLRVRRPGNLHRALVGVIQLAQSRRVARVRMPDVRSGLAGDRRAWGEQQQRKREQHHSSDGGNTERPPAPPHQLASTHTWIPPERASTSMVPNFSCRNSRNGYCDDIAGCRTVAVGGPARAWNESSTAPSYRLQPQKQVH
jgi:hypothetical protein